MRHAKSMQQQPRITQAKQAWRTQVRTQRQALDPAEKQQLDQAIIQNLVDFLAQHYSGCSLAAYLPLPSEPGGLALKDFCLSYPHILWLPKTQPHQQLLWGQLDETQELVAGAFGIVEPQHELQEFSHTNAELLLLPGLGVSVSGRRIGQGGGFYDRLLATTTIPRVLLVYSWEVSEQVPFAQHDCVVDAVLTEDGLTHFEQVN